MIEPIHMSILQIYAALYLYFLYLKEKNAKFTHHLIKDDLYLTTYQFTYHWTFDLYLSTFEQFLYLQV